MPIRFEIDTAGRRVHATAVPPVTDSDVIRYQLALAGHPDHEADFDQLCDMRGSEDVIRVTANGVRAASEVSQLYREHIRGSKLAIVVTAQVPQGIAQMLAEYLSDIVDVRVFNGVEEAEEWLGHCLATPDGGR